MPRHFGILIPSTNTSCEIEFCHLPRNYNQGFIYLIDRNRGLSIVERV
jgi:hypothetical protein